MPDDPAFSIVIPTHRRPERLAECLESLNRLDYPLDRLEVVVVEDGGPTDELARVRERYDGKLAVTWLAQPHAGPAVARNLGARSARYELLAFTDDDCRPRPEWIRGFARVLSESPHRLVGGHSVNALVDNDFSAASQDLVTYITAWGRKVEPPFFASNNIALSREGFERLGGFDESFPLAGGEDRDLSDRAPRNGIEVVYAPQALVDHYHPLGWRSFWRQHFRYGRGAFTFHDKRKTPFKISADPLRFYPGLVVSPFRSPETKRPLSVCGLLLVSQVANALGFFSELLQTRRVT